MMEKMTFKAEGRVLREIEKIAEARKCFPSVIVREALEFYLGHRSIEGTVRSEIAKVEAGINSVLKTLLIFSDGIDEGILMKEIIAAKIGAAATDEILKKIQMMRKGEGK